MGVGGEVWPDGVVRLAGAEVGGLLAGGGVGFGGWLGLGKVWEEFAEDEFHFEAKGWGRCWAGWGSVGGHGDG